MRGNHGDTNWIRVDVMKQFIRGLFWPGKVIPDRVPEIQKELDAEHGIKPAPIFKPDFYRRLSEIPNV